jgi:hypothetical protein
LGIGREIIIIKNNISIDKKIFLQGPNNVMVCVNSTAFSVGIHLVIRYVCNYNYLLFIKDFEMVGFG